MPAKNDPIERRYQLLGEWVTEQRELGEEDREKCENKRSGGKGKYAERDGKTERGGKKRGGRGKSQDTQTGWEAKRTEMGDVQTEPERQSRKQSRRRQREADGNGA